MNSTVERFNADLVTECARLAETVEQKEQRIAALESQLAVARSNAELERHKVKLLQKELFGKRTETRKVSESEFLNQLRFQFADEGQEEPEESREVKVKGHPRKLKKKKKPNPKRSDRFPEHLPRQVIEVEPDDKICPCCSKEMTHVKEELVTEKLCCSRDPFYVEQFRRPVYTCRGCETVAPTAPVPEVFVRTCLSESMVSFSLVNKFGNGLPFFRQSKMYTRWGVPLSDSMLVRHCLASYELLSPIGVAHRNSTLLAHYVLGDETKLRAALLGEDNKKYYKHGYLWGLLNENLELLYEFTPRRTHAYCFEVFDGFSGTLICDGYDGYEALSEKNSLSLAHCNYHARRQWHKALNYDKKRANQALDFYKLLSEVEEKAKVLKPEERLRLRQKKSAPIFDEFLKWITSNCVTAPPKTPIRKAANYCLKRWSTLTHHLQDGHVPFSTNELERKMKDVAIARKNFLHASSEVGAHAVALFYSLMFTCHLQQIDPFFYFSDVLRRVGEHPASKIDQLLPKNWKTLFLEEATQRYQSPFKQIIT